jgi:anti-sigma factor RsiW
MKLFQLGRHRRDYLSAYIDGQVASRRQEVVEGHLAGCASCRQELEELRTMVGMLQRVTEVEAPRSFTLTEAPTMTPAWTVATQHR